MDVILLQDSGPKFFGLPFDQIFSLDSVHLVLVGEGDEFIITLPPCTLVSQHCQLGVSLFTELTNDLGIIEFVVVEEIFWIL